MQQIGKGFFSTVYQKSATRVLIKTTDKAKLCMSEYFPSSAMFPKLRRISTDYYEKQLYESRYYPKVQSLKNNLTAFEYNFYRELTKAVDAIWRGEDFPYAISKMPTVYTRKKHILLEAWDCLLSYGNDPCFEISPRNVAVWNSKLVLLDCFFYTAANRR